MLLKYYVPTLLSWSFIICFGYLSLLYAFTILYVVAAWFESLTRKSEARAEDYDTLRYSRFTIPVSVIVPAYNEAAMITTVVRHLLNFDYPQYEVIIVNDGSNDGTVKALEREFALETIEMFYRKTLLTNRVRAVYRSKTDSRLLLVDKENGGKADALNCGINYAKYRYVCCVDGDAVYKRDALLSVMRLAVKDPATVLGVTSLLTVGRRPEAGHDDEAGRNALDHHTLINLQVLDFLRSFLISRLAWSRMKCMLSMSGAFMIWRRDLVHEMGGFSSDFTCEDIEMTFRVLEKYLRERRPVKILSLPNMVGVTEAPEPTFALIDQRAMWQRVILETVWHYRRMMLNPRYGTVGFLGMPYFVFWECLGPLMQLLAVASVVVAVAFSLLSWTEFLSLVSIQVFAIGIISSLALGLNDRSFRHYRLRDLVRLILIAPFDLMLYRPILMYASAKGVVGFLRGDKRWHHFDRNARPAPGQVEGL
jgi:biofilm PGA synthesis N-glycosyltransferase PgaC